MYKTHPYSENSNVKEENTITVVDTHRVRSYYNRYKIRSYRYVYTQYMNFTFIDTKYVRTVVDTHYVQNVCVDSRVRIHWSRKYRISKRMLWFHLHCMRRLMSVEFSGCANTVFISVCCGFACTICVDS
jgi:hypothetical protein